MGLVDKLDRVSITRSYSEGPDQPNINHPFSYVDSGQPSKNHPFSYVDSNQPSKNYSKRIK